MDPAVRAVLGVCMRWIHIVSVVTLIGGFIYARLRWLRRWLRPRHAEREQAGPKRGEQFSAAAVYGSRSRCLSPGIYNYATKASYPPGYHMWMGIKLLLVLHIAASAILYSVRANRAKPSATARRSALRSRAWWSSRSPAT